MFGDARARLSRRGVLAAALATWGLSRSAFAKGRSPLGGRIALRIPFAIRSLDPHRIDDPFSAIFSDCVFDALYAREGVAFVPALAEGEPTAEGDGLVVSLRRGLQTGTGRPIDARDVVHSLSRAKRTGARHWLAELGAFERYGNDAVRFALKDPPRLMELLASPLTSVVPVAFEAEHPDGTGPFFVVPRADGLSFVRNPKAARGPAFLDEIVLRGAPDLAASLRAFEAGSDDVGWLGAGLHAPRPHSKLFDAGAAGWIVLATGTLAGTFDAPGVTQRLLDGLPPQKLTFLGLGAPWRREREEGWSGPAGEVIVPDDSAYLIEVARTVAALLSRPSHELSAAPLPAREFALRRHRRDHLLALDTARVVARGPQATWTSLATVAEPSSGVVRPPRVTEPSARILARTMRLGVVGELRVQGARIAELTLPASENGWDLGAATRGRKGL